MGKHVTLKEMIQKVSMETTAVHSVQQFGLPTHIIDRSERVMLQEVLRQLGGLHHELVNSHVIKEHVGEAGKLPVSPTTSSTQCLSDATPLQPQAVEHTRREWQWNERRPYVLGRQEW